MKAAFCLGLAAAAVVAVSGEAQDVRALKALKSAITNWDTVKGSPGFKGWENENPCPGQNSGEAWVGVECDYSKSPARVSSLNLALLGPHVIQGTLPADLDYLNAATYITLDGQDFSGPLPASWGANGGFAALESLSIALTKISGPLPGTWGSSGGFKKLHTLTLYGNQLDGALPVEWGNPNAFSLLHTLTVSDNKLTGALPNAWATGFQKLRELNLARNKFTGRLPYAWDFPVLQNLELEGNQLDGPIGQADKWPTQLPALQKLDLSGNALTGAIPSTWDRLTATSLMLFPGNKGLCGNVTPKLAKTPDGNGKRLDVSAATGVTTTTTGGYMFDAKNCVAAAPAPAPMAARPAQPLPQASPQNGPQGGPQQPGPVGGPLGPGNPAQPQLPTDGPPQPRPSNAAPIMAAAPAGAGLPMGLPEPPMPAGPRGPELPGPQGGEPNRPPVPELPGFNAQGPSIVETAQRAARLPRPMGPP